MDKKKSKKKKGRRKHWQKEGDSKYSDTQSPGSEFHLQVEEADFSSQVTKLPVLKVQKSVSLTTQFQSDLQLDSPVVKNVSYPSCLKPADHFQVSMSVSDLPENPSKVSVSVSDVPEDTSKVAVSVSDTLPTQAGLKRSTKSRNKVKGNKSKSRNKERLGTGGLVTGADTKICNFTAHESAYIESLRWDNILEDEKLETDRIATYKDNRRQRYLAAAKAKGLGWAVDISNASAYPKAEDAVTKASFVGTPNGYINFASMKSMQVMSGHRGLPQTLVEC